MTCFLSFLLQWRRRGSSARKVRIPLIQRIESRNESRSDNLRSPNPTDPRDTSIRRVDIAIIERWLLGRSVARIPPRANNKRSTIGRPDRSFRKLKSKRYTAVFRGDEVLIHAPVLRFAQNLLHSDWNGSKLKVMRLLNRNIVMLCSCRNNFSAAWEGRGRGGGILRDNASFLGTRSLFLPIARLTLFSNTQISHAPVHTEALVISDAFAELPIKLLSTNVRLKTQIEVRERTRPRSFLFFFFFRCLPSLVSGVCFVKIVSGDETFRSLLESLTTVIRIVKVLAICSLNVYSK